ncbi:putative SNQ2-ABC transporter [Meredithblackwellia eburnea MCA 4105]
MPPAQSSAASSASSEVTAAALHDDNNNSPSSNNKEGTSPNDPKDFSDGKPVPVPVDFFDENRGELQRSLSRTASRLSTYTQNPAEAGFDYKMHLQHVLRKSEREGHLRREVGVTFKDLTVSGVGSGFGYAPSMGEILSALPRLPSTIQSMRHPVLKNILTEFTGTIRPKEMVLVLGRPGSGCTSLLKTLSNNTDGFKSVQGTISYDGISSKEMRKLYPGDVTYLQEDDVNLPTLTVGETLTFAAATRTPSSDARLGTRKEAIEETRDVLVTLFGLRHTLGTKVGNDVVRGVSGGERKRVAIAEMMTTGSKIGCHDNSTRGLDASTALEYTRALRIATDVNHLTTILSLYQAGEQIYNLFDKVCVIYEGRMAYFGPMGLAVNYFREMGYEPQQRQTSADFLVAVTDPKGRFYREGVDQAKVPKTADEFAKYFRESEIGKQNAAEVAATLEEEKGAEQRLQRFRESAQREKADHVGKDSKYQISFPMQVRLCMTRRYQMQMGELPTLLVTTIAAIFQALIIGSVYFQMPKNTSGFFSRGGIIFFAILYNAFTGMAEITNAFSQRPIVVRHRNYAMVRPSADILAQNVVDLPFKFVTIFFFDLILYFMSGLQTSAAQFFFFILFTFVTTLSMVSLFRAIASSNRAEPQATMLAGIVVLIVAIYVGYSIPRPSMHPWFRWLSYAQPVSFGFEALLSSEFRTLNVPCSILVPSGPLYPNINIANQVCTTVGSVTGQSIVSGSAYLQASFGYTYSHAWRNFGIVVGYWMFFLAVNLITTELQPDETVSGGLMIFKRGKAPKALEAAIQGNSNGDEEKGVIEAGVLEDDEKAKASKEDAAAKLEASTDVFTWQNVCYDVDIKGKTRRLLDNVSGYVAPGKMTALMGESGAGKTTLLNVLAQRTTMGVVTGSMLVNGAPLPISFQRQTGYCQQQDVHMATSSVREALVFSALLRQPASTPEAEKLAYVEEIIKLLEMESYAEAIVGEVGMGLNVEQRKRLTIAVELAAKPALLLFLDEPSSGLDSQSSWSILQLLRKLADHGQAVLATIHQPSSELFQVFDRLLLLKKGGQTVYFGDLGENSRTLVDYFGARSELQCGPKDNPAEYILEVIGAGATATTKQDWHQLWKDSDECKVALQQIEKLHADKAGRPSAADEAPDAGRGYAAHTTTQVSLVTRRVFQHYWRDPTYVMAKLMLNIVAGLFIGFSFWKTGGSVTSLQNKLFAVFMGVVIAAPLSQQLQPKFIGLRTLYLARERPSRMYNWVAMVFANVIVEIPYNIVCGTIFFCTWYWTVGFPGESSRAGYAYLMYMLFQLYYASFAQWVAALSSNGMMASILFSSFFSFVIIFNGVVQPVSQLPAFWAKWMYHLTPFTYLIEGLCVNAMSGVKITCTPQQFTFLTPPSGQSCLDFMQPFISANAGYAQVVDGKCGYCAYKSGDEFLATVGMNFSHRYRDVGLMCAYIVFNYALVFILTYLVSMKDWSKVSFKRKSSTA